MGYFEKKILKLIVKLLKSNKSISRNFCNFKKGQKSIFQLKKSLKLPKMQFHEKIFRFIWFHEFFCLDFFKFSGPLWLRKRTYKNAISKSWVLELMLKASFTDSNVIYSPIWRISQIHLDFFILSLYLALVFFPCYYEDKSNLCHVMK